MEYSCCNYRVLLLYVTALCTKNIFVIINSFASRLLGMGMETSIGFSSAGNLGLFLAVQQRRSSHMRRLCLACYKPVKDLGHLQVHRTAPRSKALQICLYLMQTRQKVGDLSTGNREKLRQRAYTRFTVSHRCFVEELRFKPSKSVLKSLFAPGTSKEQQLAGEVRRGSACWDAAHPVLTLSHRQSNKIQLQGIDGYSLD